MLLLIVRLLIRELARERALLLLALALGKGATLLGIALQERVREKD